MKMTRFQIARGVLLAAMTCTFVLCGCHGGSGAADAGQDAAGKVTLCDFDQCRSTCAERGMFGHCNWTQCECYPGPGADADTDGDMDIDGDADGDTDAGLDAGFDADLCEPCEPFDYSNLKWPDAGPCPVIDAGPVPAACSPDGWCWVDPIPSGNSYRALWDDGCKMYAVGQEGALLTVDLRSGKIIDFKNLAYNVEFYDVAGIGDGRLIVQPWITGFAIVDNGEIAGIQSPDPGTNIFDIFDMESDLSGNIYLGGRVWEGGRDHSYLLKLKGENWERISTCGNIGLKKLVPLPEGGFLILASTNQGSGVFRWDGKKLCREYWGDTGLYAMDIGRDGAIWASGWSDFTIHKPPGGDWEEVKVVRPDAGPGSSPDYIYYLAVENDDSVVMVGESEGVMGWDGSKWRQLWDFENDELYALHDIRSHNGKFYIGGMIGRLYELQPEGPYWRNIINNRYIEGIGTWRSPGGWVYVAGSKNSKYCYIYRTRDGTDFDEMNLPQGNCEYLRSIWGTSDDDIWAAGTDGHVFHYNGTGWDHLNETKGTILRSIWGTGPDNVYIVGDWSTILHWDGSALEKIAAPTSGTWYQGIWGTSNNNIYIVGDDQTVIHYNGTIWETLMTGGSSEPFFDIEGRSASEMYILGLGSFYDFDGQHLIKDTDVAGEFYNFILGPSPNEIYIADYMGQVIHDNGTTWNIETTGSEGGMWDIAINEGKAFLAGVNTLMKKDL